MACLVDEEEIVEEEGLRATILEEDGVVEAIGLIISSRAEIIS